MAAPLRVHKNKSTEEKLDAAGVEQIYTGKIRPLALVEGVEP